MGRLGDAQFRLVATLDAIDDIAFGLQIVGEQKRERLLVLDNEDMRRTGLRRVARRGGFRFAHRRLAHRLTMEVSPFGRSICGASPVTR